MLVFIQHVYHFFHNTTVNAQPLSPPIIEKITPHVKTDFPYFGYVRLVLFLLIFVNPFPPLDHIGPIVGRMSCHCWSILAEVVAGRLINEAA